MESLNRVELAGKVSDIKLLKVGTKKGARFSVFTTEAFRGKGGAVFVQSAHHHCSAWAGELVEGLEQIAIGDYIHVVGRLRYAAFNDSFGRGSITTEVYVTRIVKHEPAAVCTHS